MSYDALTHTWPAWMSEQHHTFMAQLVDRPSNSAWIGIASLDNIEGTNGQRTKRRDGRLVPLGGRPKTQAFVWKPYRDSWAPELWVAPSRGNYRYLYERFIKTYWLGANLNDVDNEVDHLFPKSPAIAGGLSHVRLLAIPQRSNGSAATLEKQMTASNALLGARTKQTRMATLYALGKAAGYVGYKDLQTLDGRRRIAAGLMRALHHAGASEEITESGLDEKLLIDTLATLR